MKPKTHVAALVSQALLFCQAAMRALLRRCARCADRGIHRFLAGFMLLTLLGTSIAHAAGWARNYGTAPGNAQTLSTAVDVAGNVYITGHFSGVTLVIGGVTLTRVGGQDSFVAKLDADGTVLWAKNYGGFAAIVEGNGVAVDGAGNVYLSGTFDASLSTPALPVIGSDDAFALKLDASGNTIWAKNYGGSGASMYGYGIAVDGSGNVYLSGYFDSWDLTAPALTKIGNSDAFALKLDASGTTLWARNYGGIGANAVSYGIAVDGSGNVYLSGNFSNASLSTPALTRIGDRDALVLKLDAAGSTVWARNYGGVAAEAYGNAIAVDGSGNVYLGGDFDANLSTPVLTRIGTGSDAFALKLDGSGTTTWANSYGGVGARTYTAGIAVDGYGNVYLSGDFAFANTSAPALTKIGNSDAFALKLDASGSPTWAKNYGGSGANMYGYDIAVDGWGNVYLGGYFHVANLTTPPLTKIGSQDAYILKEVAPAFPVLAVSYNDNTSTGGTVPTDGTAYVSGATVTVLGNTGSLVKTGSTFAGWNTVADGSGTSYAPAATFAIGSGNVTLYAKWTVNNYTVSFTSNGGTAVTSQTVAYNGTATSPAAPTKTGSTFAGWFSDVGLTSAFVFSTAITADTTLYAKWTPIPTATSIPTLSEWGMIVLSGLMAFCGFFILRRRGQLRF